MKKNLKNIVKEYGYLNEQVDSEPDYEWEKGSKAGPGNPEYDAAREKSKREKAKRDTSKDTTSGEFKVNIPVQNETEEVIIKYGHATGPVDDVTISWGNESHNVDFEDEDVIDDHGNEGKDMMFVAYSEDDMWRFQVDVSVGFNYENSGEIYEVHWDTLEIEIDDAKMDPAVRSDFDDPIMEKTMNTHKLKKIVIKSLKELKTPLNENKIQCGCDTPCDAPYGCYYIEECSPDCDNCSSSCSDPFPLSNQGGMVLVNPPRGGGLADRPMDTKFNDYEDHSDEEMKAMNVTGLGKQQCETCSDCPGKNPCAYYTCTPSGNCVDKGSYPGDAFKEEKQQLNEYYLKCDCKDTSGWFVRTIKGCYGSAGQSAADACAECCADGKPADPEGGKTAQTPDVKVSDRASLREMLKRRAGIIK